MLGGRRGEIIGSDDRNDLIALIAPGPNRCIRSADHRKRLVRKAGEHGESISLTL
jgi:hypothetical protein